MTLPPAATLYQDVGGQNVTAANLRQNVGKDNRLSFQMPLACVRR
jgi:hypothetical protein